MGAKTRIAWCEHTWNPWYCCTRISEGCTNCYMERWAQRANRNAFGGPIASKNRMHFPRSKHHHAGDSVFVCSLSDFFHESCPDQWRADALAVMSRRPELTFLLLTKRPTVAARFVAEEVEGRIGKAWQVLGEQRNVWLGVTAENQARADERIPELLQINWPGKAFVSVEPMLEPVNIKAWLPCPRCRGRGWYLKHFSSNTAAPCEDCQRHAREQGVRLPPGTYASPGARLDWVICGGESGAGFRECKEEWARALKDQCAEAGVPFFLKQYSGVKPAHMPLLDGRTWGERPEVEETGMA